MKRIGDRKPSVWRVVATLLLLAAVGGPSATMAGQPAAVADQTPAAPLPAGRAQHDVYDNVVRNADGTRINYLRGPSGFVRETLNAPGDVLSRQELDYDPFDPSARRGAAAPQPGDAAGEWSADEYLAGKWMTGLWGTSIGASSINTRDLDDDGQLEMVLGASSSTFGPNLFWYIVSYLPAEGRYQQEWFSREYAPTTVGRIAVEDGNGDGHLEIYVGLTDGAIEVYDGASRALLHTLPTLVTSIGGLVVTDLDVDGVQEIVASNSERIAVYNAVTYALEWDTTAYPAGSSLAVGNVDPDPAAEIINPGYVIDGITHAVEWDSGGAFGADLQLADIDADGMGEIIGTPGWYSVKAFDADTQSEKWTIPTSLDVAALHVGDVDADGVQEVLIGDGQWGSIHCYDTITLVEEWYVSNPEHGVTDIDVGDVDGDGVVEVTWGAGWTSTGPDYFYVASTLTHTIEWQSLDVGGPLSALDVDDVDGDGTQEIAVVSFDSESGYDDGIIFVYDAETYALEWQSEPVLGGMAWTGVRALEVADVDDDGDNEIAIATGYLYDGVILVYNGLTHDLEWQTEYYSGATFLSLGVGDVDDDGDTEVLGGQVRQHTGAEGVYVRVFDGSTGAEEWHTPDLGYWVGVYDVDVADVDADGQPELLCSVDGGNVYVYGGVDHSLEWQSSLAGIGPAAALDVDQDGELEIVVGTYGGSLVAFNGQTHAQEWSSTVSSRAIHGLRLSDMDRNGALEIVVADDEYLLVLDAATRNQIWQSMRLGTSLGSLDHLVVKDVDRDTRDEVVIGSSYALFVFTFDLMPYGAGKEVHLAVAAPGDTLSYTLELTNYSSEALSMVVTDTVPLWTSYVADSLWASAGEWEIEGETIGWRVTSDPGQQASLAFAVTVDVAAPDGTEIANTAIYTAGGFLASRTALTEVDAVPPYSEIVRPVAGEILSGTLYQVAGTAGDSGSGVERVQVRIGDGGWEQAAGTVSWTVDWTLPLADTLVTIQAQAVDGVGHIESPGPSVTVLVDNLSPHLVSTSPVHGSTNVAPAAPVVLVFSEPIDGDTLSFTCQPDPGGWSTELSGDGTTVTLSHTAFEPDQMVSCLVAGVKDRAGHGLVAGPVPNPWAFITASPRLRLYLPVVVRASGNR